MQERGGAHQRKDYGIFFRSEEIQVAALPTITFVGPDGAEVNVMKWTVKASVADGERLTSDGRKITEIYLDGNTGGEEPGVSFWIEYPSDVSTPASFEVVGMPPFRTPRANGMEVSATNRLGANAESDDPPSSRDARGSAEITTSRLMAAARTFAFNAKLTGIEIDGPAGKMTVAGDLAFSGKDEFLQGPPPGSGGGGAYSFTCTVANVCVEYSVPTKARMDSLKSQCANPGTGSCSRAGAKTCRHRNSSGDTTCTVTKNATSSHDSDCRQTGGTLGC